MAKVKFLGCKELVFGENKRANVGFVEITPETTIRHYINHHILLADVSGSMSGNIGTLKERVITTLKSLLQVPDSYVSIITYSGHQQSKRIITGVKCEETSYSIAGIWNVIEEELYIKSVTVMSEPLEQSVHICKSLADVCNKHHIALFTDGCLVPTRWNEESEREKCFKVAEICSQESIFLNAVGFGQYYDRAFLKELIEIAGNGTVIHIDEIKDYSEVILNIIRKVNSETLVSADISVREGTLFHLPNSIMKSSIQLKNIHENGIVFAVINSSSFTVDNESYPVAPNMMLNDSNIADTFYYSLARYYLQEEDVDTMEYIVKTLGDAALYEKVQNCYSFIERGNALKHITDALENKSERFTKGRYPMLENGEEKLCILEILQSIIQDKDSELYWDMDTPYHRITQHTRQSEDHIVFKGQDRSLIPVSTISIGSEKLNIGIKVRIDGEVSDSVSGFRKEACIYRDFNIVNSGNVNIPYIHARLSKDLFDRFLPEGILEQTIPIPYDTNTIYMIHLQGIKSTNKRILKSMMVSEIATNLYTISELKSKQWAINQLIKEITAVNDKLSFTDMSTEEQEIRRILRIDSNGIYSPVSAEKDNDSAFEIYPAMFLTWNIAKFPEKHLKELYLRQLRESITDLKLHSGKDDIDIFHHLNRELSHVRAEMRNREFKVNSVRIASAITNKSPFLWEESGEKSKTCTDKVLNRNMVVGGKLNFCKKNIGDKIIEQQKWVQLIKCN